MPADLMEKNSSSPVAATPASMSSIPDKPKTASEHRKVNPNAALSTDPTVMGKYRAGFSECMMKLHGSFPPCEGVNTDVRTRIAGTLANCMNQINTMNYPSQQQISTAPLHPAFGHLCCFSITNPSFPHSGSVIPVYANSNVSTGLPHQYLLLNAISHI
ncbi:hypothetical protein GDO86_010047 [Hymenochirus boettgeri]|uniref:Orange domain-containing protein n=1 Tax=Hymenochirus boettgeri TaxID=247094 RepID=A0A8T2JNY6_9PIPI|nr:hypothetical protein GDO86_010047 [Hymenochirus boettgeri]